MTDHRPMDPRILDAEQRTAAALAAVDVYPGIATGTGASETPAERRERAGTAGYLLRRDLGTGRELRGTSGHVYSVREMYRSTVSTGFAFGVDDGTGWCAVENAGDDAQGAVDAFLDDLPGLIYQARDTVLADLHSEWTEAWRGSLGVNRDMAGIDYMPRRVGAEDFDVPDHDVVAEWQGVLLPAIDQNEAHVLRELRRAADVRARNITVTAALGLTICDLIRAHVHPGDSVVVTGSADGTPGGDKRDRTAERVYDVDADGNVTLAMRVGSLGSRMLHAGRPTRWLVDRSVARRGARVDETGVLHLLRDGARIAAAIDGGSTGRYKRIIKPVRPRDDSVSARSPLHVADPRIRLPRDQQTSVDYTPSEAALLAFHGLPFLNTIAFDFERSFSRGAAIVDDSGHDTHYSVVLHLEPASSNAQLEAPGITSDFRGPKHSACLQVGTKLAMYRNSEVVLVRTLEWIPESGPQAGHFGWITSYGRGSVVAAFMNEYSRVVRSFGLNGPAQPRATAAQIPGRSL